MTRETNQARVNRHLLRLHNGASAVAIANSVMPLDKVSSVEQVLAALITQGLAVSRKDGEHLRYFHATRAPLNFRKRQPEPAPSKPPEAPAATAPPPKAAKPAPRPSAPPAPTRLTPQVPPKQVRKPRPRAGMPQPVALRPADRIAAEVADFLARGGRIEKLASGVVSRPLQVIGTAACPVEHSMADVQPDRAPVATRKRGHR